MTHPFGHRRRHHRRQRRRGAAEPGAGLWGAGMGRFFGPGEVRLALLSLIEEEPRHGYELMKALEEKSQGMYRASAGTVYPTLQQLEDEGLVASEAQEGKRVYRLTEAGSAELESETRRVDRIWKRAQQWGDWGFAMDPDSAEVFRPVARVAKAAFRAVARGGDDPDRIERVREILDDTLEQLKAVERR